MGTFTWIIIIIIIFGFLSRVSKKVKETARENPQNRTGENPQPNLGGTLQEYRASRQQTEEGGQRARSETVRGRVDERDAIREAAINGGTKDLYESREPTPYQRETEVPYERESVTPYYGKDEVPYEREMQVRYQRGRHGSQSKAPDFSQLTKDQWAQGIILSEVLGPPRSKRPHRTANQSRKS